MKGKEKCKGGKCSCEGCMNERVEKIKSLGFDEMSARVWTKYNSQAD